MGISHVDSIGWKVGEKGWVYRFWRGHRKNKYMEVSFRVR